jgi:hypothetical protein
MAEELGIEKAANEKMPLGATKDYGSAPGYGPGKDRGVSLDDGVNANYKFSENNQAKA